MLQTCFDPGTIHCQYNIALAKLVSVVIFGVVGWPPLYVIPAKATLDYVVSPEKANVITCVRILRLLNANPARRSISSPSVVGSHPFAALGEDGVEVAFEQGAGVLEVLFGVGFGGGDALKRFVEDADDPPLFGKRREYDSF